MTGDRVINNFFFFDKLTIYLINEGLCHYIEYTIFRSLTLLKELIRWQHIEIYLRINKKNHLINLRVRSLYLQLSEFLLSYSPTA